MVVEYVLRIYHSARFMIESFALISLSPTLSVAHRLTDVICIPGVSHLIKLSVLHVSQLILALEGVLCMAMLAAKLFDGQLCSSIFFTRAERMRRDFWHSTFTLWKLFGELRRDSLPSVGVRHLCILAARQSLQSYDNLLPAPLHRCPIITQNRNSYFIVCVQFYNVYQFYLCCTALWLE